jgi:hypothetical protein
MHAFCGILFNCRNELRFAAAVAGDIERGGKTAKLRPTAGGAIGGWRHP